MPLVLGITGPNAAGKGEVAAYLAERGFRLHSLSDVVREEAAARNLPPLREHLIQIGNEMRAKGGPGVLAARLLARIGARDVVDSIRNPAEVAVLRAVPGFVLIGVRAVPAGSGDRSVARGPGIRRRSRSSGRGAVTTRCRGFRRFWGRSWTVPRRHWQDFNDGLPDVVQAMDLNYTTVNNVIRVMTHGNGAYERKFLSQIPTDSEDEPITVTGFKLEQNFPNPFNPTTNFEFRISNREFVSLRIYDVLGNEITTLVNQKLSSGIHNLKFDGTGLPSGTYFYRLEAGNYVETKKMVLLK